jgi:hypothetical protein
MSRFQGQVFVDPKYSWENQDALVSAPGEPDYDREEYERELFLIGSCDDELRTALRRDQEYAYPKALYDPFSVEPALFRIFAALDGTPESILGFAQRYGALGTIVEIDDRDFYYNQLATWRDRIGEMRQYVEFADNYLRPAGTKRTRTQTAKAAELVTRALVWAQPQMTVQERPRIAVGFVYVVGDLWSVLSLQLAEAIVDERQFRDCDQCGKPFATDAARSDREFCSANCRVKAHYRRKKKAEAMRAAGKTLNEISKATGSDISTIKKWVNYRGK